MAFIRTMCFFNSIQHHGTASAPSVTASQGPQQLPAAGPSSEAKLPEGAKAADSDAAMARGMPGQKDQLQKDPTVEHSVMEGAAADNTQDATGGPNTRGRAPVGDLLKPFTIYLQASIVRRLHCRCTFACSSFQLTARPQWGHPSKHACSSLACHA
jgi:hypothetical protein